MFLQANIAVSCKQDRTYMQNIKHWILPPTNWFTWYSDASRLGTPNQLISVTCVEIAEVSSITSKENLQETSQSSQQKLGYLRSSNHSDTNGFIINYHESDSKIAIDSITGKIQAPKAIVNIVKDINSFTGYFMNV